jgi:hypothetical protein
MTTESHLASTEDTMMYIDTHPDILLRMIQTEQRLLWKEAARQRLVRRAKGAHRGPAHTACSQQTAPLRDAPQGHRDDVWTEPVGSTRE